MKVAVVTEQDLELLQHLKRYHERRTRAAMAKKIAAGTGAPVKPAELDPYLHSDALVALRSLFDRVAAGLASDSVDPEDIGQEGESWT